MVGAIGRSHRHNGSNPGSARPAGSLGRWVAATDNGILVTDLWQKQEQEFYDAFAKDQTDPCSLASGFGPP